MDMEDRWKASNILKIHSRRRLSSEWSKPAINDEHHHCQRQRSTRCLSIDRLTGREEKALTRAGSRLHSLSKMYEVAQNFYDLEVIDDL